MNSPENIIQQNAQPRLHNTIFQCVVCQEFNNFKLEKAHVVTFASGVVQRPMPDKPGVMAFSPALLFPFVCDECFKDLDLELDEQKIIVPTIVPPREVAEQLGGKK